MAGEIKMCKYMVLFGLNFAGAWRSLVAHLTGGQVAGGSNPLAPTIVYNDLQAPFIFLNPNCH